MQKHIDASELQQQLLQVIDDVTESHTDYIVLRNGRGAAALISYEEFERWQRARQETLHGFDRFLERMRARNAAVPEDEVAADVEAAIAEVRERQ